MGDEYRGRIVAALGTPVDGLGGIECPADQVRSLESQAPGIMDRRSVHEPFYGNHSHRFYDTDRTWSARTHQRG